MTIGQMEIYHNSGSAISKQTLNWVSPVRAILLDAAYTLNLDTHQVVADVIGQEIPDNDYDQLQIAGQSINLTGAVDLFDCNDADFGASVTISAGWLILAEGTAGTTGNDATDKVIFAVDLDTGGGNVSSENGQFAIRFPSGVYEINWNAAPAAGALGDILALQQMMWALLQGGGVRSRGRSGGRQPSLDLGR